MSKEYGKGFNTLADALKYATGVVHKLKIDKKHARLYIQNELIMKNMSLANIIKSTVDEHDPCYYSGFNITCSYYPEGSKFLFTMEYSSSYEVYQLVVTIDELMEMDVIMRKISDGEA